MGKLFRLDFAAGTNKRDTGLANKGGIADSNFVRYRSGLAQPIGGWQVRSANKFTGKARGCHAWRTLEGTEIFAFGTDSGLFSFAGGQLRDITPPLHNTTVQNIFSTTNGSPTVTVTLDYHLLGVGDTFTVRNMQGTIGGLTLSGDYPVTAVNTPGEFTITAASNATSTASLGGGYVDIYAALPVGRTDAPILGYGTKSYGEGAYGASGDTYEELRTWALDNWGENLMANPTGYGLFEWQPEISYVDLAFNGGFTGNANGWALGTGWAYGTNNVTATAGTASNLSQSVDGVFQGGRSYTVTFTVTVTAGTLKFRMNAGATPAVIDVGSASSPITKSGTYTRTFLSPADPKDIIFEKDATFAGTIDNVSYMLESKPYRITTAPPRMDTMFVDPRGVVVALGTTNVDGNYSATTVRTSDLGNNRAWVPDTDSYASEYVLRGGGGRLMQGLATSEQSLVGGDDGVFSFQWQGVIGNAYNPRLLGTKCGLISRHAMAEQNGFVGWMSPSKQFFFFRGVSSFSLGKPEVIECKIQEDVFDNLDWKQALKCYAGINPQFTEIWFSYPDARDTADGDYGECSRIAMVDWTTGTWAGHNMARTCWQASGVFQNPLGLTPSGYIMEHEVGHTAQGALLDAYIETSDFDSDDGTNLLLFTGIVPDFKDQIGDVGFTVRKRMYPNAPEVVSDLYVSTPTTRVVNFRHKARQYRVRMSWVTTGGWGRCGALRFNLQQTGARN